LFHSPAAFGSSVAIYAKFHLHKMLMRQTNAIKLLQSPSFQYDVNISLIFIHSLRHMTSMTQARRIYNVTRFCYFNSSTFGRRKIDDEAMSGSSNSKRNKSSPKVSWEERVATLTAKNALACFVVGSTGNRVSTFLVARGVR